MSGAWGTEAVERAPIEEIPLITEVHIDGLVRSERWQSGKRRVGDIPAPGEDFAIV